MVTTGLTKESSETIGFVIASLFSSAISTPELREWAKLTVGEMEFCDIPEYMFDLVDFNGFLSSIYQIIGFDPVWNRSDEEGIALVGLALKRGRQIYDLPARPADAQRALSNNVHIEKRFREVFPFVNIQE